MKKKIFFAIALIILVILEISIVYADVIIPGQHFNRYNDSEKIEVFIEKIGSPVKEIVVLLSIFTFVLGMVLLAFNFVKDKNSDKSNSFQNIMGRISLGMNVVLNLLQIHILKSALFFYGDYTGVRTMPTESKVNPLIIRTFYIVYAVIILLLINAKKKKKEKPIYIVLAITTILLFIICVVIVYNTPAGYYTHDESFYDFFGL